MLGALEAEALGVVDGGAGLHAEEGVVGLGVLPSGVVAVVRGQERRPDPAGQGDQLGVGPVLLGQAVVLELDEEAVLAEDVLEPAGEFGGPLLVPRQERLEDHTAQAPRGGDEPRW